MNGYERDKQTVEFGIRIWMVLVLASVLPHLPYLWTFFFMDDFWHLAGLHRGDYIFSSWKVGRENIDQLWYMRKEVFPQMAWVDYIEFYFRPVYLTFLWFDYKLFEYSASFYHIHSQIWHSLNTVLLAVLLRKIGFNKNVILIAAITFAIHPMVGEPLGWISARCDLQLLSFCFLSMIFYLDWKREGKAGYLLLHLLMFILAMGCKEHAVAFPFVVLFYEILIFIFARKDSEHNKRAGFILIAFALAVAFITWRILDTGGPHTWSMPKANLSSFEHFGPVGVLGNNLVQYLKLAISGIPPTSFIALTEPPSFWFGLLVVVVVVSAIVFYCIKYVRHPLSLMILWASGFLFAMVWMPPSGRYFYPAAPGIAVIFAYALNHFLLSEKKLVVFASKFILVILISWWTFLSLAISFSEIVSANTTKDAVYKIVDEIEKRPEVKDVYLLHLWPILVSSQDIIPVLSQRDNLKVHVLTFASSLYNPRMLDLAHKFASMAFLIHQDWFDPLKISNLRLTENILVVKSEPHGFFSGPATFGWNSQHLPRPKSGILKFDDMNVQFGPEAKAGGLKSIMFTFPDPLDDPSKLWMEYRDGYMQVWEPNKE